MTPLVPRSSLPARLRQGAGTLVLDSLFRLASSAGQLHPASRPERHGLERTRDVRYRETGRPEHLLDVYRPTDRTGLLPAVLYMHGGAFCMLSKDSHWVMALAFARRGMVVFNANYRLAPRDPFPAAIEDACAAYRWVVANAARWGADPERIVLAGESAGANLATAIAITSCWRRREPFARAVFDDGVVPRAVLPACGILQVTDPDRFRRRKPSLSLFVQDHLRDMGQRYLGSVSVSDPRELDLADPLVFLETGMSPERALPPFFAGVGTKDAILDDTRRLSAALRRLGAPCESHYYPGELHAFHAVPFTPGARRFWAHTYSFLARHSL